MTRAAYAFLISCLMISACKKNDGGTCYANPFSLKKADREVTVEMQSYSSDQSFEIEYGPAGFTQGSGTKVSFSGGSSTFTVTDYGNYDVYVRTKCGSSSSDWTEKSTVNVDGGYSSCALPVSLNAYTSSTIYRLEWYGNANFYDIEYGPSGFIIGNGTRLRTNNTYTNEQIMNAGLTYDFYVRANCGGATFSSWAGPHSVYAATDQNINTACTQPTNLYAYKTSSTEISYTSQGHGSISYEVSISTSNTSMTSNILSVSSPNGGVYNSGGFSGTRYFWIRGKCVNNSFTPWSVSQVQ